MENNKRLKVGRVIVITKYAKNERLEDALDMFDKMPMRDVVSWNVIVAGYVQNGRSNFAGRLFNKMTERNGVYWPTMIMV